jgi:hypothetical protein
MQGEGLSLLETRLSEGRARRGLGIDFITIIGIITALLPLIQNCFNPQPQALRRRLLNRARLAVAMRRENPGLTLRQAMDEADAMFDLADKATDAELQLLIDDCCK